MRVGNGARVEIESYEQATRLLGLNYCSDCQLGDHHKGFATRTGYHLSSRHVTRRGLRKMLTLIAPFWLTEEWRTAGWRRVYAASAWAQRVGLEVFRVRFPARFSAEDRARVAWLTRKTQNVPRHIRAWAHKEVS